MIFLIILGTWTQSVRENITYNHLIHIWLEPYPEFSLQSIYRQLLSFYRILYMSKGVQCSQWSGGPIQVAGPLAQKEIYKSRAPGVWLITHTELLSAFAIICYPANRFAFFLLLLQHVILNVP